MASHPYSLLWLPEVLRNAGVKVEEVKGWQYRGHGDVKDIQGVLLHHTAGSSHGNMPSLDTVVRGRSDLLGPLCNLALGRDGTYYVVAAGKAWHAGTGHFPGISNDGNSHLIGIEAENTGYLHGPRAEQPWSAPQMEAYKKGVLALLKHKNLPVKNAIGHKEWAPSRKTDPTFDMNEFRHDLTTMESSNG